MKDERDRIRDLIEKYGGRFSVELGIDLESKSPRELFKWFMASLLFGARISQEIAIRTYKEFEKGGVTSPENIVSTGWGGMIPILGAGGYARYDNRTANKLLDVSRRLLDEYGGSILNLIKKAKTPGELEARLRTFKGVGEVTANIFLRELRGIFLEADPSLSPRAVKAARALGFVKSSDPREALEALKHLWAKSGISGYEFADFEAALIRYAR